MKATTPEADEVPAGDTYDDTDDDLDQELLVFPLDSISSVGRHHGSDVRSPAMHHALSDSVPTDRLVYSRGDPPSVESPTHASCDPPSCKWTVESDIASPLPVQHADTQDQAIVEPISTPVLQRFLEAIDDEHLNFTIVHQKHVRTIKFPY